MSNSCTFRLTLLVGNPLSVGNSHTHTQVGLPPCTLDGSLSLGCAGQCQLRVTDVRDAALAFNDYVDDLQDSLPQQVNVVEVCRRLRGV